MIRRYRIIFLLIIVFLAILLSLPIQISKSIKIKLTEYLSPLIKGSGYLVSKAFSIKDLFGAVRENRALRKKLEELSIELNKQKEIGQENERLKQLLDLKKTIPYETIACRIIARDAGAWYKTLVIDKGENSGVNIDMPVLSSNGGVIGRVVDCTEDVSRVLLVTDVNSSIGGIIQDTRTVGLVEGNGSGECFLNLIPKNALVEPGSTVVTSGLGEIFPKGLIIGEIEGLSSAGQDLYKVAKIKLHADIDRIEEILVIKSKNQNSKIKIKDGVLRSCHN